MLCETICGLNKNCNYFVYNAKEQNCQLHATAGRSCDLKIGPVTPKFDTCEEKEPCDCCK